MRQALLATGSLFNPVTPISDGQSDRGVRMILARWSVGQFQSRRYLEVSRDLECCLEFD